MSEDNKTKRRNTILAIILILIFTIQFSPHIPRTQAQTGSIIYNGAQNFNAPITLTQIILDSTGDNIYASISHSTTTGQHVVQVQLNNQFYAIDNITYPNSGAVGTFIASESIHVDTGVSALDVGLTKDVPVTVYQSVGTTIIAANEEMVYLADNRATYNDGVYIYVLTKTVNQDLNLWSNRISQDNNGSLVYSWTNNPYLVNGYLIASFAYDASTQHLYVAFYKDSPTPPYYDVVIVEVDVTTGQYTEIYSKTQVETYPRYLTIYNGALYALVYEYQLIAEQVVLQALLFEYNIATGTSNTISLYSSSPSPDVRSGQQILKVINNKIVVASDLQGIKPEIWVIGISEYDPSTGLVNELGIVNITEITGLSSAVLGDFSRDITLDSNGYYRLGLARAYLDYNVNQDILEWYIILCSPSAGGGQPPPQPPTQPTTYNLTKQYTFGGNGKTYTFLNYHAKNSTSGYVTGTSRIVDTNTNTIDNTSAGIAVVFIDYDNKTNTLSATMIADVNNLLNATGSFYIPGPELILFYGYKMVSGWPNASITVWNGTAGNTASYVYPDYKYLASAILYLETNSTGITTSWLIFIDSNGNMLNTTNLTQTELTLTSLASPSIPALGDWGFMDVAGFIDSCLLPEKNSTLIVVLEPDNVNSKTLIKIYNLTRQATLTLYDITPASMPSLPLLASGADASIGDIACSGTRILINLNYFVNSTSFIILVNLTDGSVYKIYTNQSTRLYQYYTYSSTPLVGASYLPPGGTLRQGLIYSVDPITGAVNEVGYLSTNANEEIGVALILGGAVVVSIGESYHSPSNLTIASYTISVTPVPENNLLIILPIIAALLYILVTRHTRRY